MKKLDKYINESIEMNPSMMASITTGYLRSNKAVREKNQMGY